MAVNYANEWNFIDDALYGTGGFIDGSYLEKYSREDDDKYKNRQKIAYYKNDFMRKITRYIGYLFRKLPIRDVKQNPLLETFLNDCDKKGNSLTVFMSDFSKEAKAKGVNVVLIDNIKEIPQSLQEQINQRALPYLVPIKPEQITEYKMDSSGRFEYVAFSDTIDLSEYKKPNVKNVIRYFDKTSWIIYEEDKILESGEHNLGVCPIIFFSENGKFETFGEFSQIAYLAKRRYNLVSEEDEIIRGQTFSILTVQGEPSDLALGVNNALFYSGDKEPKFIAPSAENAKIIKEKIEKIDNDINEIAYDIITLRANNESGRALKMKLDGLNSSLSDFAIRLEDFEYRIFEIVQKYLNLNIDVTINYNKNFNLIDIKEEIDELSALKEIAEIPSYERAKLKKIAKNDLGLSDEDLLQISEEIDNYIK